MMTPIMKVSALQAMPGGRTSNLPLNLRSIFENQLYPVPLWVDGLKLGNITIIHVAEHGHRFARKTGDNTFEIIDNPEEHMEIHVVRMDYAILQGWVRITAPPPMEPRSAFYGGDVSFSEV